MSKPPGYAELDPTYRLEFDALTVKTWRVTWPDGTTETVEAHSMQWHGDTLVAFIWNYIGSHRIINTMHVRDITQL